MTKYLLLLLLLAFVVAFADANLIEPKLIKEIGCYPANDCDYILASAYSAKRNRLALGDENKYVRIFDVSNPKKPVLLQALSALKDAPNLDPDYVLSVAFSPDGNTLVYGDDNFYLTVYTTKNNWKTAKFKFRKQAMKECAFTDGGDYTHPRDLGCFRVHGVAFSPNGKRLAVSTGGTTNRCSGNSFEPKGCAMDKNVVTIFRTSDYKPVETLDIPNSDDYVEQVAWTPDGSNLIAVDEDSTISIWKTSNWKLLTQKTDCGSNCNFVTASPNGKFAAVTDRYGSLHVYNTKSWTLHTSLVGIADFHWQNGGGTSGLAFSPDSTLLVVTTETQTSCANACMDNQIPGCDNNPCKDVSIGSFVHGYRLIDDDFKLEFKFGGSTNSLGVDLNRDISTVTFLSKTVFAFGSDDGKTYIVSAGMPCTPNINQHLNGVDDKVCGVQPRLLNGPGAKVPFNNNQNSKEFCKVRKLSFDDAKRKCQLMGARLCTYDEIIAGEAKDNGCRSARKLHWTSTPCTIGGKNTYKVAQKNGSGGFCPNARKARKNYVTCCRDLTY